MSNAIPILNSNGHDKLTSALDSRKRGYSSITQNKSNKKPDDSKTLSDHDDPDLSGLSSTTKR